MAKAPDKNSLTVDGTPHKIENVCSHIAAILGSKKRVTCVEDRNGVRFKAGNRTVAIYDGESIIDTTTNSTLDLSKRSDMMHATAHAGSMSRADKLSYTEGMSHLEKIQARSYLDDDSLNHVRLGNVRFISRDYQGALDHYSKASTDIRYIVPTCGRAFSLAMMNRYREANTIIDECLKQNSDAALVRSTKVEILADEGRLDEIVKFTTRHLKIKPHDVGMTDAKFHALFDMGNYEEVIAYADLCLAISDEAVKTIKEYVDMEDVKGKIMVRSMLDVFNIDGVFDQDPDLSLEKVFKMNHIDRMGRDYSGDTYKTLMYVRKIRALNRLNRHDESLQIIKDLGGSEEVDQKIMQVEKSKILDEIGRSQ